MKLLNPPEEREEDVVEVEAPKPWLYINDRVPCNTTVIAEPPSPLALLVVVMVLLFDMGGCFCAWHNISNTFCVWQANRLQSHL